MSDIVNVSRRDFLRTGLLAGGGLVLGLHLPALAKGQGPGKKDGPFALNAFVRVGSDDHCFKDLVLSYVLTVALLPV